MTNQIHHQSYKNSASKLRTISLIKIKDRITKALQLWEPRISLVDVEVDQDPADAQSAIATIEYKLVATQVKERVVPGLCRTAAEAAFIEAYWRAELRRGRKRVQIEETLNAPDKNLRMRRVATLALFDGAESGDVRGRLASWGSRCSTTYQVLNAGAHQGYSGSLANLVDDTEKLVDQITRRLR